MSAREQFQRHQRVMLTPWAIERMQPSLGYSKHGVVVGFSRDGHLVRVLRDGLRTVDSWAPQFWQPEGA